MATPRQVRRRGRFAVFAAVFVGALVAAAVAFGAVQTDQQDYAPGSVVTISGDNSNGAGYLAGETVDVAVAGPNGWASSCSGVADDAGAWSCQVTLDSDPSIAAGSYSYTATGESSAVTETGAFTDTPPPATNTSLTVTPGTSTGNAGEVYYGDTLTFAGSVTSSGTPVTRGSIDVKQSKERKANLCATADFSGNKVDIYTQNITDGTYSSGAFWPVLSAFPTNSITAGNYAIADALNPPLVPDPIAYVSAVGMYAFETSFSDSGLGHFASSDSPCQSIDVVQAPTTTTSQPADGSGVALTQVGVGVPFYVEWGVSSVYGVTGNTAAGSVALTQSGTGLGCPAGSANAKTFTATETTGSGFSYAANAATNPGNRFGCNATAAGVYTVNVTFTDNAQDAATNPDGNYGNSSSANNTVTVTQQVQACMAAPAIAAAYLKAHNIKNNSPKYDNIVQLIANEMATSQQARFPTYTYTTGSKILPTAGPLLRPCDNGYVSSVQGKTQYYIDTLRS